MSDYHAFLASKQRQMTPNGVNVTGGDINESLFEWQSRRSVMSHRDADLRPAPERPDWHDQAACRDTPTAVFFDPEHTLEALAICDRCPVRRQCAEAGRHEEGIWGGLLDRSTRGRTRPGRRVGTPVTIVCAECGEPFMRVTQVGITPTVCGYRCRQDRNLRQARAARAKRRAS